MAAPPVPQEKKQLQFFFFNAIFDADTYVLTLTLYILPLFLFFCQR